MDSETTGTFLRSPLVQGFFLLSIGILLGTYVVADYAETSCAQKYAYIHTGMACSSDRVIEKHKYADLKARLTETIEELKKEDAISSASVYFRDLRRGPTFGINEYEKIAPAGLLKVILLLTYLNYAHEHPEVLAQKITYVLSSSLVEENPFVPPIEVIDPGTPYTVEDLLSRMVMYGDDKAYTALKEYLLSLPEGGTLLRTETENLGITPREEGSVEEAISVKSYLAIFHALYFSWVFPSEVSEKALSLLTQTHFDNGLVAGLPEGTKASHRLGGRVMILGGTKQLHDCGIVYYPGNPYSLCVMVQGSDAGKLPEVIQTISRMVYEEVDSRRL